MSEHILTSLQKQIDTLTQQLADLRLTVAQQHSKQATSTKLGFGNADALSRIIPAVEQLDRRTLDLRQQDFRIHRRLSVIYRAHNRHTLSTVAPKQQVAGWARDVARDRRTWAKPKGWRL